MTLLSSQGYFLKKVLFYRKLFRAKVVARNWNELDQEMRHETLLGGVIFEQLQKYGKFF